MRTLIYVPIIHNYADMGIAKKLALDPDGERYEFEKAIDRLWNMIGRDIAGMNLDFRKIMIYQDSWCETSDHKSLITNASRGSRNYQLILRYLRRGATLIDTEKFSLVFDSFFVRTARRYAIEPELFFQMRMFIHAVILRILLDTGSFSTKKDLDRRDAYVAKRIQDTLGEGQTGILFMGADHGVDRFITA